MLDAECLPISLCARTRTRALSNLKLHHVPRTLRTCIYACQAPEGKPVLAVARRLIRHGHRGLQERNIVSDADEGGIKDRCWARHLLSGLAREGRHHIMIIDHFGCSPTRQISISTRPFTLHPLRVRWQEDSVLCGRICSVIVVIGSVYLACIVSWPNRNDLPDVRPNWRG